MSGAYVVVGGVHFQQDGSLGSTEQLLVLQGVPPPLTTPDLQQSGHVYLNSHLLFFYLALHEPGLRLFNMWQSLTHSLQQTGNFYVNFICFF